MRSVPGGREWCESLGVVLRSGLVRSVWQSGLVSVVLEGRVRRSVLQTDETTTEYTRLRDLHRSLRSGAARIADVMAGEEQTFRALLHVADDVFAVEAPVLLAASRQQHPRPTRVEVSTVLVSCLRAAWFDGGATDDGELLGSASFREVVAGELVHRQSRRAQAEHPRLDVAEFTGRWQDRWDEIWAAGAPDRARWRAPTVLGLALADRPPLVPDRGTTRQDGEAADAISLGLDRSVYDRYRRWYGNHRLRRLATGRFADDERLERARTVPADADEVAVRRAAAPLGLREESHREVLVALQDAALAELPRTAGAQWARWVESAGPETLAHGTSADRRAAVGDKFLAWRLVNDRSSRSKVLDPPSDDVLARVVRLVWSDLAGSEINDDGACPVEEFAKVLDRVLFNEREFGQPAVPGARRQAVPAVRGSTGARVSATARLLLAPPPPGVADSDETFTAPELALLLTGREHITLDDRRRYTELLRRLGDRFTVVAGPGGDPQALFVTPDAWLRLLPQVRVAVTDLLDRNAPGRTP